MKKRLFLFVLVTVAFLAIGMTLPVAAEDVIQSGTWENLSWTLNESTGELVISGEGEMASLADQPVWLAYSNKITSVIIQDGVTSIGPHAFKNCKNLSSVTIPDSVVKIGYFSFWNCNALTEITIPNTDAEINDDAFSGCEKIYKITAPIDVIPAIPQFGLEHLILTSGTNIPMGAFQDQTGLISIQIPDTVTEIGAFAFYNCINLESIVIPSGVTTIGDQAFQNCEKLESVVISDNVLTVGKQLFLGCKNLRSVVLPQGLTSIGDRMFDGCASLESITLPTGVTEIGNRAFYGCASLSEIIVPDKVTEIGNYAFSDCVGLKKLVLPKGIQTLSGYTFDTTKNIEFAVMPISLISYVPKNSLKTVVLTGGTSIPEKAFSDCTKLEKVVFCGSESEWKSLQKNQAWLKKLKNTKFLYHDCQWEIGEELHTGTCLMCNVEVQGIHTFEAGVITSQPTHLATGTQTYSCLVCQKNKTVVLDKVSTHLYGSPTKSDEQQHQMTCACGDIVYEAHNYGDWTVVTPSTESSEGERKKVCVCGHEIGEKIPALQHEYEAAVIAPTCTEQGYTEYSCKNCQDSYRDSFVERLGHTYDDEQDAICNECGEERALASTQNSADTEDQTTAERSEAAKLPVVILVLGVVAVLIVLGLFISAFKRKKHS